MEKGRDALLVYDDLSKHAWAYRQVSLLLRPRIRELLDRLSLWERRRESVGSWSRGMKQKLAIARVLLHRPALVFLDEPTAGLDPVAAAGFREELDTLVQQEGLTVFLTTHNLAEAEKLCHQVGVLRQGKLLGRGQTGVSARSSRRPSRAGGGATVFAGDPRHAPCTA